MHPCRRSSPSAWMPPWLQGTRVADMAGRFGAEVVELKTEAGTSFSLDTLAAAVEKEKPAVLFLCQVGGQGGGTEGARLAIRRHWRPAGPGPSIGPAEY